MGFKAIISASSGELQLVVQDDSTMADLNVSSGGDVVTVYCGYRTLGRLAGAFGAAIHSQLNDTIEVETESGVDEVEQPSGVVAVSPAAGGADITVDDKAGHMVRTWFDANGCSQASVAFAAASNGL